MQGPGRPDIVNAGSRGKADIVNAGSGETRYSECRVQEAIHIEKSMGKSIKNSRYDT
ncbi:unnamed protein product [Staurois parvus]|uniref:Uncharacterized protein n=1 Tax=Staurois parvus TaxID=386267 RepID=A0ABN9F8Y4_9NEOB|nr:unnamed protein product [Staurois parvus]